MSKEKPTYKHNPLLYVLILILVVLVVVPVFATITQTDFDANPGEAMERNFESSLQFSDTDTEGVIRIPLWGPPTAIDYVYWTTADPQTNGEEVYFLRADYIEGSIWSTLTVTRVDLDGNDAFTADAIAVVCFTWE